MAQINIADVTATIASGQSLSGPIAMGVGRLYAIVVPPVWTAANLTFQVSPDGGVTWYELYDNAGNEIMVVAGAGNYCQLIPTQFSSVDMIKVRSGTPGSPVNQTAGRSLILVTSNT